MKTSRKKHKKNQSIVAVDVFCGAAGLSYGLKASGIKIAAGIDLDPACKFPFEKNIGAKFVHADVCALSATEVERLFGDAEIRLLAGCAPCQPFSGYTARRREIDGRWELLFEFLRLAKSVRPEIITLENVSRLALTALWASFVKELQQAGYKVTWDVLDASNYGVPQARKRLVLLASLLGEIQMPHPVDKRANTVRTAIEQLPPVTAGARGGDDPLHAARALTPKNLKRIRASRPAGTWREWPKGMQVSCHKSSSGKTYPSVYGRMSWDKPSPTITTQFYGFGNGRFGHPEQDRAITLREGALLQSFPADFEFSPSYERVSFKEIGRLIGNAVPPALAHAIGNAICDHLESVHQASK